MNELVEMMNITGTQMAEAAFAAHFFGPGKPDKNPETNKPDNNTETNKPDKNPETNKPDNNTETSKPDNNTETNKPDKNPDPNKPDDKWTDDKSGSNGGGSNGGGSKPAEPGTNFAEVTEMLNLVVAGDEKLCGSDYDVTDTENIMILKESETYEKVYPQVQPGYYTFAVHNMGDKDTFWGEAGKGDKCSILVSEVCDVTVTFNAKMDAVTVTGDHVEVQTEEAEEAADTTETVAETTETIASETVAETTEATVAVVDVPAEAEGGMGGGIWMFAFLGLLVAAVIAILGILLTNKKKAAKLQEQENALKQKEKKMQAELEAAKAAARAAAASSAAAQAPLERTELHDAIPAAPVAAAAAAPVAAAAAAPIPVKQPAVGMRAAVFQGLGARKDQQDSYGMTDPALYGQQGIMAIVADGMGGLANGKAVSSALVNTFLGGFRSTVNYDKTQDQLMELVTTANQRINQMLVGADRSGSTLLAVVVREGRLFFLTVGDSRIYLYRGGALLQLNREHIYQEELAVKAANRQVPLNQVTEDRQAHSLTSFIGIGNLTHMDRNYEGIRLLPGDRIMLCSDGVFGTLTQDQMEYALNAEDVRESARLMRDMIVDINKPYQDNNTGLILEYLG